MQGGRSLVLQIAAFVGLALIVFTVLRFRRDSESSMNMLAALQEPRSENLIAYSVIGDMYTEILSFSLSSLERALPEGAVQDVLLFTTAQWEPSLAEYLGRCGRAAHPRLRLRVAVVHLLEIPDAVCFVRYQMLLMDIVRPYTKVLYMDVDMVFLSSPASLFSVAVDASKFYYCQEGTRKGFRDGLLFSLGGKWAFTAEELARFETEDIVPFNAGFFVAHTDKTSSGHAAALLAFALREIKAGTPHFTDQSFANHYMNTRGLANTRALSPLVFGFFHCDINSPDVFDFPNTTALVHFLGCGYTSTDKKLHSLRAYWARESLPRCPFLN